MGPRIANRGRSALVSFSEHFRTKQAYQAEIAPFAPDRRFPAISVA